MCLWFSQGEVLSKSYFCHIRNLKFKNEDFEVVQPEDILLLINNFI